MLLTTAVVPVQEPADSAIKESDAIKESYWASGSKAFLTVTTQFKQTQQSVTKLQSEC